MYTVLLADDEKNVIDTVRESIACHQFGVGTVLHVSDGRQALEETIESALNNIYADTELRPELSNETLFGDKILLRWLHNAISIEELIDFPCARQIAVCVGKIVGNATDVVLTPVSAGAILAAEGE